MKRNTAILISTCDNYYDIWSPFFTLLEKYWQRCPYKIYVNSETIKHQQYETFTVSDKNISWTKRLKLAVSQLNEDYIIFMLDDFFITRAVNGKRMSSYISEMEKDSDIAAMYISPLPHTTKTKLYNLKQIETTSCHKVNLTMAIWNKEILLHYLQEDESIWEFELNAPARSLAHHKFYTTSAMSTPAVPYEFSRYGLFAGKWFKENIKLFKKNKIEYNFSKRGFYEDYEFGTIPYIQQQIKLDSFLLSKGQRMNTHEIVSDGYFRQSYNVKNISNFIWYIAHFHGFAISGFKCSLQYQNGKLQTLNQENILGNFRVYDNDIYFLDPAPFAYVDLETTHRLAVVILEGNLMKFHHKPMLKQIYNIPMRHLSMKVKLKMLYIRFALALQKYGLAGTLRELIIKISK